MGPPISMGFSISCKHLLIITVQNVLGRVNFCLYFSQTLLLETEIQKTLSQEGMTLAVSLEKLCALMKGSAGLIDASEPGWQGMALWLLQVTPSTREENRWAGFFTPYGKLWLIFSILDMETHVRTHKLITMKKTWCLVHKYSPVSDSAHFSFIEGHQADSLLVQTNKGLDAVWPSTNSQGNLFILALPFVCR